MILSLAMLLASVDTFAQGTLGVPFMQVDAHQEALHSPRRLANGQEPFALICNIDIPFLDSAVAIAVDGDTVYRLGIKSPGAYSLGLWLQGLVLADGCELSVYGDDPRFAVGPLQAGQCKDPSGYRIAQIPGDSLTVELFVPNGSQIADFRISRIYYDFSDFFTDINTISKSSKAGACASEKDVACYTERDYSAISHAVLKYAFDHDGYSYFCTGTLVNSLRADTMPLVLTAAHCICDEDEARSAVFYFNYQADHCRGGYMQDYQTISGARIVATAPRRPHRNSFGVDSRKLYPMADFSLLSLPEEIPANYKPYFAGISLNIVDDLDTLVCLHHPNGSTKKISVAYQAPYIDSYPAEDDECHYNPLYHWHIAQWNVGTTEGGSSGSALFNTRNQIVGTLSGGYASCTSARDDFFQMISKAWAMSPDPDCQLKYWLSPNSDTREIPPFDPYNVASDLRKSRISVSCDPDSTVAHLQWAMESSVLYGSELIKPGRQGTVLPKVYLTGHERLVFKARSINGDATLSVMQNTRPQRFRELASLQVTDELQEFSIDLSNLAQDYTYIRLLESNDYMTDGIYIFDLKVELVSSDLELTGYQLYCNGKLVRTINSPQVTFCDYEIAHGESYSFYVLNLYGDKVSGLANIVTVAPSFTPQSTPVSDLDIAAHSVRLYPNPARESATVHFGADIDDCELRIFDANGRECRVLDISNVSADSEYPLSLLGLPAGVYYIKVCSGARVICSLRLVVI